MATTVTYHTQREVNLRKAIVISASSDIGLAMCDEWLAKGYQVAGTFRTPSEALNQLKNKGLDTYQCDLSDRSSVIECCQAIKQKFGEWDTLVLCPGLQDPVGLFQETDFDEWEQSIIVNFSAQMRIIHLLLPFRRHSATESPSVLSFAGGGTNNATQRYSAYTISKIALIKMTELLASETPDTRFTIVGPGWVKTKIHQSTLDAGKMAGENYALTQYKLQSNELTPMRDVLDCCNWLIWEAGKEVNGRNFSVVFDQWGSEALIDELKTDTNMYKLRRNGNDKLVKP
jgi:NAD(P)-dependent dehydrogenase (short-subunit alcohol dehydrogenase family)